MISSSYLRRLFFAFISLLPFIGFSGSYRYWVLRYNINGLLYAIRVVPSSFSPGAQWVTSNFPELASTGAPHFYYKIIASDPPVYLTPGYVGEAFDADDSDVVNANNLFGSIQDPLQNNLYDLSYGLDSGIPRMKPVGTPILDNTGKPVGVVGFNKDGEKEFLPTVDFNGGYGAAGYDSSGQEGIYYISPGTDGMYPQATFTPVGGAGGSGGGSGGGNINTSKPTPITDNIPNPAMGEDDKIETPKQDVDIPTGGGGGGDGEGNVSFSLYNYTSLLQTIAKNQIEGINRMDENFSVLNQNLQTIFGVDSVSDVAPNTDPSFDTSSVDTEVQERLDDVSTWDFSFGLGSNPIGDIVTSLIGSPPTSFGRVDSVWEVDFTLFNDVTVHSSFKLSDYFIPAFRSLILFIFSIFFAIAVAHQISKAWS